MKKKNLLNKMALGLAVVTPVSTSCTNDGTNDTLLSSNQLSEEGAIAINLTMSKEDYEYLNLLEKLSVDIVNNPLVAKQFAKDPQVFLEQYGYKGKVALDEDMLRLILALGDDEINQAVNSNDIATAVKLMEKKGLFKNLNNTKLHFSKEQKKYILDQLGINHDDEIVSTAVAVVPVYAIAIAISQAAVVYNAAAAINVYAWVEVWGTTAVENDITDNELVLKLWSLKDDEKNTYIAADIHVNNQVDKIIATIKEHDPEVFKHISQQDMKELIKYNIIQGTN